MPSRSTRRSDGASPPPTPKPTVENRWWVDQGKINEKERRAQARAAFAAGQELPNLPGAQLFRIGMDFDQDRARARLTDPLLNLLREGNPATNEWAYLPMIDDRSPPELIERVKRVLRLPPGARGVLVDSGSSLRVIVTGTPLGERLVELTLGGDSCLDAWSHGDWVRETVFRDRESALRQAPGLITRHLSDRD